MTRFVLNELRRRGRVCGLDVCRRVAANVPLRLVGMDSASVGGDGELSQQALPAALAAHRFFFHPIRHTSLGLAVIEAMLAGIPVVGLATTELVTVIRSGDNGSSTPGSTGSRTRCARCAPTARPAGARRG